jgi:hypothetical protein
LAAVGHLRILPGITTGQLFTISRLVGEGVNALRSNGKSHPPALPPEVKEETEAA